MQNKRLQEFYTQCELRNLAIGKSYYWYHTIDLGNGLITPGVFDFRKHLIEYNLPDNMEGLSVLDVGAATGYFSFEFAKRGAIVTATELPSLFELDTFPGQNISDVLGKAEKYAFTYVYQKPENYSLELLYHMMLKAPFDFCSHMMGISIPRKFVTIYNLSEQTIGNQSFDWVFIGDVLLHTIDPLRALTTAANMCSGTLVIAQYMSESGEGHPNMLYIGGESPSDDVSAWWRPNLEWFKQVLKKSGFRSVEVIGNFTDEFIPNGHTENKTIIHAKR